MNKIFGNVGKADLRRSVFDLSHEVLTTMDMGYLYPIQCDEVVPGDIWSHNIQLFVRCNPLVAPMMHPTNICVHSFFVPYRLLTYHHDEEADNEFDWETFISGGPDGDDSQTPPEWRPSVASKMYSNTLWDHLGFPALSADPTDFYPLDFPRQAYNLIYNEFYRDENLISELAVTNEDLQLRCWEKDYFTSALPWQQRGTSPALPISGTTSAEWDNTVIYNGTPGVPIDLEASNAPGDPRIYVNNGNAATNALDAFNDNEVDLSSATTFDVADLRLAFQIQKWLERNARGGVRYIEFLKAHFGVSPRDDRLQRPEYLGGLKTPLVISEVLQTSETATTPQGTLAGHGISVENNRIGTYRVQEYGLIMTIMSIMPKPLYMQGINKQWARYTKYDFFFPEFVNLSEQAISNGEIYCQNVGAINTAVFGYQGRYDEMRVKQNRVSGDMNSTFDYWHMARQFVATPTLNQTFVECDPRDDAWAAPDEAQFMVAVGHRIKAVRPLPYIAEPGLIDHV